MAPRGEFEFTFNDFDVGVYPYYCIAHPWMTGSVVVVNDSVEIRQDSDDNVTEYGSETSRDNAYDSDF